MDIGQRIMLARKANRMSQRALAAKAGVSAMAVSKYERNETTPSSAALMRLARSMDVPLDYFFRPNQPKVEVKAFRKHASLRIKEQQAIQARIQEWLDRYFEIEDLLPDVQKAGLPHFPVSSIEDAESAASGLRQTWRLGIDPIENLAEVLEDRGIKVGQVDGFDDFDACTFLAGEQPVVVTRGKIPGDRQRFNLAHELGHLVMDVSQGVNEEMAANRFAGAFLVPAPSARFELGEARTGLDINELYVLKRKYGLSMQAWIYRARDLEIISDRTAAGLFQRFRRYGWNRQEPGEQIPAEKPVRMQLLVYRALAEDLISRSRAQELLGKPLKETWPVMDLHQNGTETGSDNIHEHKDIAANL